MKVTGKTMVKGKVTGKTMVNGKNTRKRNGMHGMNGTRNKAKHLQSQTALAVDAAVKLKPSTMSFLLVLNQA